jgi:hypothetical protein
MLTGVSGTTLSKFCHAARKIREMKRVNSWFLALSIAISTTALSQEPPDVNVFSFGDTSCAAWARSAQDEERRELYIAWFRGFVSGYNYGNSGNQVPLGAMPKPAALAARVDKFCRENPLLPFVGAIIPLIQEIRLYRTPADSSLPNATP